MTDATCSAPDCSRTIQARGLCTTHYSYWWREHNTQTATCTQCGEPFRPRRTNQKTCGAACHSRAATAKRLDSPGWLAYQERVQAAKKPKETKAPKARPWVGGVCRNCSQPFLSKEPARYCTTRCRGRAKEHRRFKARGEFAISDHERTAIYERDGYICHLCDKPVDRNANYLEPYAATLDHVIPQSLMLVPDHSPKNLKTAHRICNAKRGNSPVAA